jgi:hypothetical protein
MPHWLEQAIVTCCGRLEYHHKLNRFRDSWRLSWPLGGCIALHSVGIVFAWGC